MLEGVKLADYADNQAFFGTHGSDSDYGNIFKMAQEMYRELRLIKRISDPEASVDRRYIAALNGKFSSTSTEAPIDYKEPPKGATPDRHAAALDLLRAQFGEDGARFARRGG